MDRQTFHIGYLADAKALPEPEKSSATDYLHRVATAASGLPTFIAQQASSFWFDVGEYRCFYELDLGKRTLTLTRAERRDDRGLVPRWPEGRASALG